MKSITTIKTSKQNEASSGLNHVPIIDDEGNSDHDSPTNSIAFQSIKRKVLRELYGLDDNHAYNHQLLKDKSPKGSVDEEIRSIIDLINSHPSFVTLSSCSGRIALFNPVSGNNHTSPLNNNSFIKNYERVEEENMDTLEVKGKGFGSWLLSSHAEIDTLQLKQCLDTAAHELTWISTHATPTLLFKHEPLLLHVAASHLTKARILLQLALELGFRESGIVYTPKRITVAIRGHSLALNVPLAPCGPLRPDDNYLHGLVQEANTRFKMNQEKLLLLYKKMEMTLFHPIPSNNILENHHDNDIIQPEVVIHDSLPDLNLWGHAAVAIPSNPNDSGGDVDVYVFGGYGVGPICTTTGKGNEQRKGSARSKQVYLLQRRHSLWDRMWQKVPESSRDFASPEIISYDTLYGKLYAKRTSFSPCEGLSACVLSCLQPNLIAIFGGRESPLKPNNNFLLFNSSGFYEPLNMAGEVPTCRWGHSLVALTGNCGHLALVIGGRDESKILSTAYVLSFVETMEPITKIQTINLLWSRLDVGKGFYYPSVVSLPTTNESTKDDVFVFGGYRNLDNPFSVSSTDSTDNVYEDMHISLRKGSTSITKLDSNGTTLGASCCILQPTQSYSNRIYILSTGGFDPNIEELSRESTFNLRRWDMDSSVLEPSIPCNVLTTDANTHALNFGSLVHNVTLSIPSTNSTAESTHEMVIVGGGSSLFAFGESFAKSYSVSMRIRYSKSYINTIHTNPSPPKIEPSAIMCDSKFNDSDSPTSVLFVKKSHAKQLKTALESCSYIDRRFRMASASQDAAQLDDPSMHVAVPVTSECLRRYVDLSRNRTDYKSTEHVRDLEWVQLVTGYGQQTVPYSSALFGLKRGSK